MCFLCVSADYYCFSKVHAKYFFVFKYLLTTDGKGIIEYPPLEKLTRYQLWDKIHLKEYGTSKTYGTFSSYNKLLNVFPEKLN